MTPNNKVTASGFWEEVFEEARTAQISHKPILLTINFEATYTRFSDNAEFKEDPGHALLILGIDETASKDDTILKMYDVNSPEKYLFAVVPKNSPDDYSFIYADSVSDIINKSETNIAFDAPTSLFDDNGNEFSIVKSLPYGLKYYGAGTIERIFSFSLLNTDSNDSGSKVTNSSGSTSEKLTIRFNVDSSFYLENSKGQYISFTDDNSNTNMDISNFKILGGEHSSTIYLDIPYDESFSITKISGNFGMAFIGDSNYRSVVSENASKILINNNEIKVDGDDFNFNVCAGVLESSSLISVSGHSASETNLTRQNGIITVKSDSGIDNVEVNTYSENEATKKQVGNLKLGLSVDPKNTIKILNTDTDPDTPIRHTIFFDPGDWNSERISFFIYDKTANKYATKDGWSDTNTWGSKKTYGTKLDNGLFESFEFDMPEDHDISVIFLDPDTSEQTFSCFLDPTAYGDTAKRTGTLFMNYVDDERFDDEVKFEKSGLTCPMTFHFTGVVQGTMITKYMNPAAEVANYLDEYHYANDTRSKVTPEKVADGIKKFGTTAQAVFDEYMKNEYADEEYARRMLFPEEFENEETYTYYYYLNPEFVKSNTFKVYADAYYYDSNGDYHEIVSSKEMTLASEIGENVYKVDIPVSADYISVYDSNYESYANSELNGYKDGSPYDSSIKTDNFDGWVLIMGENGNYAWFTKDNYMNYKSYDYFANSDELLGDVDGDGVITSGDALLILRASTALMELEDSVKNLADINDDNVIDSADALLVLRQSIGI